MPGEMLNHAHDHRVLSHHLLLIPITLMSNVCLLTLPSMLHRGNVDVADPSDTNPECRLIQALGWSILLLHIVGAPPTTDAVAAKLIHQHRPDIVVFGHSHKACIAMHDGIVYLNPGSAGMLCYQTCLSRRPMYERYALCTLPGFSTYGMIPT